MFKDAVKYGKSRGDIPALILGFVVLFSILVAVRVVNAGRSIEPKDVYKRQGERGELLGAFHTPSAKTPRQCLRL